MNYKNIAPPFTLDFWNMSKKEIGAYYNWFLVIIPERIKILTEAVKTTPGFEKWKADYTVESLDKLGEWFAKNVGTRERTQEEIEKKIAEGFEQSDISKRELTTKTFSLAVDIGMYLSQVFLKNVKGTEWYLFEKGGKRFIDYGQPVLKGFGNVPFNPVQICITLAYSLVDKSKTGNRLRELYEIWKKIGEENNK